MMNKIISKIITFFFLLFPTINLASEQVMPERKLSKDELLQNLEKLESQIKIVECNINYQEFQVKKPLNEYVDFSKPLSKWLDYGEPQKTEKKVNVLIEPVTGRVHIKDDSVTPGSTADSSKIFYIRSQNELTYDGQLKAEYHNSEGNLPDIAPSEVGIINKGPLTENDKRGFFTKGLDVFLSCYQGDGFKKSLLGDTVDTNSIEGKLQSNGFLEVYLKDDQKHRFLIDTKKGGAILSSEHFSSINDKDIVYKIENSWVENQDGYWVPKSSICVSGNNTPSISLWTYEQVKINHIRPTPEMFRLNFPKGTEVFDIAGNIIYIADAYNSIQSKTLIGQSLPDMTNIGIGISSQEVNDKMILFCFFDIEQRPSRNCILELSKNAKGLKSQEIQIIAIQSSKIEQVKLDEWLKENKISFPVGIIKENEEQTRFNWGVKALPWLILTDKEHVITVEGFSIDEIGEKLQ